MKKTDFTTLNELFLHICTNYSNANFLNYLYQGNWRSFSTQEFYQNTLDLAYGFKELGITKDTKIAIMAESSPWWVMVNFAANLVGAISVPIFFNISNEHLEFELKDSEVEFMFLGTFDKLDIIEKHPIKQIITLNCALNNKNKICIESILDLGKKAVKEPLHVSLPDELCSIIYTSGNTGTPKGVMLSHTNIVAQIKDTSTLYDLDEKEDVALSFLPLAHIFERMVMTFYLSQGISVYFADDVKNVSNLLKEIHPTVMTVVPRLLEKVYTKIHQKVEDTKGLSGLIARFAYEHARGKPPEFGKMWFEPLLHSLVYKKFLDAFGGELRMLISGGSSLDKEIYKFFINIGLNVYEGYGLTEFSPVITANSPKKSKWGTCGPTFPSVEVKLTPDGELLARGPSVMKGYLHRDELTKQTIDNEGWLHTGDLATIDDEGFISISGRKKELYKTSTGNYVSPIPIEQELSKYKLIDFAVAIAEDKPYTVALFFPDFEMVAVYKKNYNLNSDLTIDMFFKLPRVKKELDRLIKRTNKKLDKWQRVVDYRVIDTTLSIEGGELTPSMKIRRNQINSNFKKEIDSMYNKDIL
ncbi:AMP-dependent synthetase/ligase [Sulfurospirillum arcachonense]|uniref:AMP-dependent synthetase/ligase n=1 Tax=Sulfurospirillum arcachonense TaxID=57666 RepID=UPI00046A8292|nr:long-chain fatty acid--CoA ligase [Sulfurospirillum arcachonense]